MNGTWQTKKSGGGWGLLTAAGFGIWLAAQHTPPAAPADLPPAAPVVVQHVGHGVGWYAAVGSLALLAVVVLLVVSVGVGQAVGRRRNRRVIVPSAPDWQRYERELAQPARHERR